jgi:hypothetical protein
MPRRRRGIPTRSLPGHESGRGLERTEDRGREHSKLAQGPFALQFGNGAKDAPGGAIKFRKVEIKPL